MAIHQMENWAWNSNPEGVSSGDTLIMCNLVQFTPNTKMFDGLTGLTFIHCNLINCELPEDAETERCNTGIIAYEVEE